MQISEIVKLLDAEVLAGSDLDHRDISTVHASDLISEVLASCSRGALWLTGLLDAQIVNTAELFDLACVVFVGNRRPPPSILDSAEEEEIPVLLTKLTMYEACGILYCQGLKPAKRNG